MNHFSESEDSEPVRVDSLEKQVFDTFGDLNRSQLIELIKEARRIKSRRPSSPELPAHTPLFRPTLGG